MKTESQSNPAVPEMPAVGDEFLAKPGLAARLNVNVRTIERWQREGLLPYLKVKSVVLFHWPEVVAHLKANFRVGNNGNVRPAATPRRAE